MFVGVCFCFVSSYLLILCVVWTGNTAGVYFCSLVIKRSSQSDVGVRRFYGVAAEVEGTVGVRPAF